MSSVSLAFQKRQLYIHVGWGGPSEETAIYTCRLGGPSEETAIYTCRLGGPSDETAKTEVP